MEQRREQRRDGQRNYSNDGQICSTKKLLISITSKPRCTNLNNTCVLSLFVNHLTLCNTAVFLFVMRQWDVDCVEEKGREKQKTKKTHSSSTLVSCIETVRHLNLWFIKHGLASYQRDRPVIPINIPAQGFCSRRTGGQSLVVPLTHKYKHTLTQTVQNECLNTYKDCKKSTFKTYAEITGFSSQKRVILQCQGYHNKKLQQRAVSGDDMGRVRSKMFILAWIHRVILSTK